MFTEFHSQNNYGEFSVASREISPLHFPDQIINTFRMLKENQADGIRARIAIEIDEKGMSTRDLSIKAGLNPDTLGKFMSGKTQSLKADNLAAVAKVLEVTESYLIGTDTHTPRPSTTKRYGVSFGGIVEAGPFRPDDGLNQDNEWRVIPIPPDPRYPLASQYAFEVRGDSMTEAHVVEGMWALAVDVATWERLHGSIPSGKLVVVARTRNSHPERELTVKRLRYFADRMVLQPESRNPAHEPIAFPLPLREDASQDVRIIAVVLQATWIYD